MYNYYLYLELKQRTFWCVKQHMKIGVKSEDIDLHKLSVLKQHTWFYSVDGPNIAEHWAAHSNLQRQNIMYSHKKYVILQHLLLMRLIVDTRWAEGAKRTWNSSTELLNRPRPLAIPNSISINVNKRCKWNIFQCWSIFFISRKIGFLSKFLLQTKKNRLHSLYFGLRKLVGIL